MVGFLPPLVQEAPLSGWAAIGLYALSSAAAGTVIGWLLGLAGDLALPLGPEGRTAAFGLLTAACGMIEIMGVRARLPERRAQVPSTWLYRFGQSRAAMMYGASMGSGLVTYITYAGFYPLLLWGMLRGPQMGAVLLGFYGSVQSLPVVAAAFAQSRRAAAPVHGQVLSQRAFHRAIGLVAVWLAVAAATSVGAR
jgi:hypothetical protein